MKAGQIASLEERAKAMGIPLSYYRQYSLKLVAMQENMMSLSGQIMSMAPGDERSKAESDLARMADEYESFIDALSNAGPYDLKIVEKIDGSQLDDTIVEQTEDTVTLLDKFVDDLETDLDKNRIKSLLNNMYKEACEETIYTGYLLPKVIKMKVHMQSKIVPERK